MSLFNKNRTIAIIGLGYVGLPIAIAFGKKSPTIGFDINENRLKNLRAHIDLNNEVSPDEFSSAEIIYTSQIEDLKKANFYIVTVPTPIDTAKQPDLTPLVSASHTVGQALKQGDIVVYESTVYPGVTEEECLPILEKISGLKAGIDFKVGYSPERINPGDHEHSFVNIVKVVSGMDQEALQIIANTYETVVKAGVHRAANIKTAEAAKVIENTQRDLNIALMNELSIIFDKMSIDTQEVLNAAGTKWNFLKFTPGLVGGHCIGVDPYYLTHKAEKLGYHPQVILAGRRINDGMGKFIATQTLKSLVKSGHSVLNNTVTVLGLTFKENCPDIRNTRVIDIINELKEFGLNVQIHDPLAHQNEARHEYGIELTDFNSLKPAAAVIVAVAHDFYKKLTPSDLQKISQKNPVLIDIKALYNPASLKEAGFSFWRL